MTTTNVNKVYENIFSGADIIPYGIYTDGAGGSVVKKLTNIAQISVTVHQDIGFVRQLGSKYPSEITEGPLTIAGSIVFASAFDNFIAEMTQAYRETIAQALGESSLPVFELPLTAQIPPFDLYLLFVNEYMQEITPERDRGLPAGTKEKVFNTGMCIIRNLKVPDEAINFSIDDITTERVIQYVATDFIPPTTFTHQTRLEYTTVTVKKQLDEYYIEGEYSPSPYAIKDTEKDIQRVIALRQLDRKKW